MKQAKLYLLYDGQRLMKKKTHVKKRTLNPVGFIHNAYYNLNSHFLKLTHNLKSNKFSPISVPRKRGNDEGSALTYVSLQVFNESFVFDLPPAATQSTNLDKVSLLVSVLDWDRVTKNEVCEHSLETLKTAKCLELLLAARLAKLGKLLLCGGSDEHNLISLQRTQLLSPPQW